MSGTTKLIQFYDLASDGIIAELPYMDDLDFLDGDEVEIPTIGAFKIVRRRWSISRDTIILVVILEPLA